MLDERYYMRQEYRSPWQTATVRLLLLNASVYLIQLVLEAFFRNSPANRFVMEQLTLSPYGLFHGKVWQLFTYQFLHGGILHLLLNSWALWIFGREIENDLGPADFLKIYFLGGAVGGLLQGTLGHFIPAHFGGGVVGASGGICSLVAAYCLLYPHQRLTLLVFFILPITLTAKWMLILSFAVNLFGMADGGSGIAYAAHVGGLLFGMAYVHWVIRGSLNIRLPKFDLGRKKPKPVELITVGGFKAQPKTTVGGEPMSEEFISREVDPILDKISAHGIQSLTPREKEILEAARARMSKRP